MSPLDDQPSARALTRHNTGSKATGRDGKQWRIKGGRGKEGAGDKRTGKDAPLGQAEEEVAARAFCEARDAEPARLAVVLGPAVAGDRVLEDLAAAARGLQLGRVGEVADDGDARDGARRRGGEGAAGRGGAGRAAEEERRGHV